MITFITEDKSIFAVEQNVEKNGKFYDEIFWAEIQPSKDIPLLQLGIIPEELDKYHYCVTWQDDWKNKNLFETVEEAKDFVLRNFTKHTGFINGGEYNLD